MGLWFLWWCGGVLGVGFGGWVLWWVCCLVFVVVVLVVGVVLLGLVLGEGCVCWVCAGFLVGWVVGVGGFGGGCGFGVGLGSRLGGCGLLFCWLGWWWICVVWGWFWWWWGGWWGWFWGVCWVRCWCFWLRWGLGEAVLGALVVWVLGGFVVCLVWWFFL
ncbi:hypothetical protein [Pseudomonas syringae group genomosp. 7]|uniref:hypothetical protein n=1 Tax=Pseudomonas syringae group genomosp. 7 TaxID=251699 RepID=UPI00376F5703